MPKEMNLKDATHVLIGERPKENENFQHLWDIAEMSIKDKWETGRLDFLKN